MKKLGILLLLLAVSGCALLDSSESSVTEPEPPLTRSDVRDARQIVIETRSFHAPITHNVRCVFEADGKCQVQDHSFSNVGGGGGWASHQDYELSLAAFAKIRRILLESKFLDCTSGNRSRNVYTLDSDHLEVQCGTHVHHVSYSGKTPRQCRQLTDFISELPKRRKVVGQVEVGQIHSSLPLP